MINRGLCKCMAGMLLWLALYGCKSLQTVTRDENRSVPEGYNGLQETRNTADVSWKGFFADPDLIVLIDTALKHNQELNITLQELEIARNEIASKRGEYLPFAGLKAGLGVEKSAEYTRSGAVEENLEIRHGKKFPEPLGDFMVGASFSWELDIWRKLRNDKKAAVHRYLSGVEGKNFMVTNLVAEIASAYYELLALDSQLEIIRSNIEIQRSILRIISQQKDAARTTQLAVNRFEAQLLNTENLQYEVQQEIVETENKINFLAGRFPQPVTRSRIAFSQIALDSVYFGTPAQLLENRPDIRQAEQELAAARLDVQVARAAFYPSLGIGASAGFQAFNPAVWLRPESIFYNAVGDMVAPLINRNAIKAAYSNATARQIQAVVHYEQTVLKAYMEVVNQMANMDNNARSYDTKSKEAEILTRSVTISNSLFKSARADYSEVLLTQREALQSRMELIEIKTRQLNSKIAVYKALGGGWR